MTVRVQDMTTKQRAAYEKTKERDRARKRKRSNKRVSDMTPEEYKTAREKSRAYYYHRKKTDPLFCEKIRRYGTAPSKRRWDAYYNERRRLRFNSDPGFWVKARLVQTKQRAGKTSVLFNLKYSDFSAPPETCFLCSKKLVYGCARGEVKTTPNRASFDRRYPDQGYTVGNVDIICMSCNVQKGKNSPDDLRRMADIYELFR